MAHMAPRPEQIDEQLKRLLHEKLAGNQDAVRQVQALIHDLRAAQLPAAWEAAPPQRCDNGRIPHC
jgi:hypothetical protein